MRLKSFFAALGIAMSIVLGLDVVSFAATGHGLLGRTSSTTKMTGIDRTRPGFALALFARPGSAPLYVNSTTKVPNLNADRVDGLDGSQLATRQTPVRVYAAPALPGRILNLTGSAQTLQQVTLHTPAECGAGTRHVYLAQHTAWANGTASLVRASIDVDSTGVQFVPGFTLAQADPYASLAGNRTLVLAPGTHTVRTSVDQFSGSGGEVGDPNFLVTDLGYRCSGGPVTARVGHADARTATGR